MNTETVIEKTALVEASAVELGHGTLKATALASFVPIEAHLTTLAARYDKVAFSDLATPKGLAAAKAIRLELREQGRFAVQRLQKRLKDEANDLKRIVDDRSEELIAIIRPVEDNAHGQIEVEETRRAEAKAERERLEAEARALMAAIEADRVAGLQAGITKIRGYVARCQEVDMTAERIAAGMAHLEAQVLGAEWGDHLELAQAAQAESLAAMRSLHTSALAREQRAREMEAQRIENERVAAEQAEQRRVLDAQAAEFKANMDRLAGHQRRIDEIKAAATGHEAAPAADLAEAITAVAALDVSEGQYQELAPLAQAAQAGTLAALRAMHATATAAEALATDSRAQAEEAQLAAAAACCAQTYPSPMLQDVSHDLSAALSTAPHAHQHATEAAAAIAAEVDQPNALGDPIVEPAGDFSLPDFDGDALDPTALAVESEAEAAAAINVLEVEVDSLVDQLAQCRAALTDALDLLEGWIVTKCPKKFVVEHFAHVAKLRDMGGLPRATPTTTKE